jgi:hypothetical protein
MQPRNLPAVPALAEDDDELGELLLELELGAEVLEPHAASSATALRAAAVLRVALTDTSYVIAACAARKASDLAAALARTGSARVHPPKGCPKANGGRSRAKGGSPVLAALLHN